jgi:hypothetical protein
VLAVGPIKLADSGSAGGRLAIRFYWQFLHYFPEFVRFNIYARLLRVFNSVSTLQEHKIEHLFIRVALCGNERSNRPGEQEQTAHQHSSVP